MRFCILISALCVLTSVGLSQDVGVDTILFPNGAFDSCGIVIPRGIVANYGDSTADLWATMTMDEGGGQNYIDSVWLEGLSPGVRETVAFTGCIPSARDSMTAIAWTSCAGDTFPADDTWRQSFTFDSIKVADVSVRPLVPETVMLTIPRELYARSCGVTLDIAKLTGQYAVLAGLKLYQCEPYRRGSGGGDFGGMQAGPCGSAASFCDAGPTVFGSVARISYVVTGLQPVTVAMYDAQGRIVRTLAAGEHAPGTYALQWDGTDAHGVRVPAGAYFCRLGAIGPVRKLVLTR